MKRFTIATALIAVLILAAAGCKQKTPEPEKTTEKPVQSVADTSAGKEKLVMELFEVMGLKGNMVEERKKIVDDMVDRIPGIAKSAPGADMLKQRELDNLTAEITPGIRKKLVLDIGRALDPDTRIDKIYKPLYMKHFTAQEISELIEFFKSKTGKKYSRKTNDMSREIEKKNWEMLSRDIRDIATRVEQEIRGEVLTLVEPVEEETGKPLGKKLDSLLSPKPQRLNRDVP